ncbi:hypothetical protein J1N35_014478 [Gossypium stocksii]|uniref:Reverse transcriptase zinc-binding domain-containing protein n=1 Tax=Gossypium stocksii TaxID=47602 RepID=A0A9D3VV14_9ROSI|nr:hypothetical protein J1N35_014478 [Gossypium stocksii]
MVTNKEALWVQVIRAKYQMTDTLPISIRHDRGSFLWNSLTRVWPLLCENLWWSIRDRCQIRCWEDAWIPNMEPLIKFIPTGVNISSGCCLNDMVNEDGLWNLDLFKHWLPKEVIELIMGIPPCPLEGPDKISLCHTLTGNFTVKSAYKICKGDDYCSKDDKWKSVWKFPGAQRVHFFIWLVLKQCLLSNIERVKRNLADDPSCPICGFHSEDILHILRDCLAAKDVWSQIISGFSLSRVASSDDFCPPLDDQVHGFTIFLNTDGAVRLDTENASIGGLQET